MTKEKYLKDFSISIIISLFIILGLEIFIAYALGFKNITSGDRNCKVIDNENKFSTYKPNCKIVDKHWENDRSVEYIFNEYGRRDGSNIVNNSSMIKIASIGDSFTFGAMVPINENYNYYAFKNFSNQKYLVHNFGVSGEQLDNIINKLIYKEEEFKNYDFILYGLTPNDFFEYLSVPEFSNKNKKKSNSRFKFMKSLILSSSISRFLLHKQLSNDSTYYSIYLKRKPYSGYLNLEFEDNWLKALEIFENKISELPYSIKSKLKIILLPQRAEVVGYRLGLYNDSFARKVIQSCKKIKVDCLSSNIRNLSLIKESHFPVDGHLTIEGNRLVGQDLANWAKNWPIKKENK